MVHTCEYSDSDSISEVSETPRLLTTLTRACTAKDTKYHTSAWVTYTFWQNCFSFQPSLLQSLYHRVQNVCFLNCNFLWRIALTHRKNAFSSQYLMLHLFSTPKLWRNWDQLAELQSLMCTRPAEFFGRSKSSNSTGNYEVKIYENNCDINKKL